MVHLTFDATTNFSGSKGKGVLLSEEPLGMDNDNSSEKLSILLKIDYAMFHTPTR